MWAIIVDDLISRVDKSIKQNWPYGAFPRQLTLDDFVSLFFPLTNTQTETLTEVWESRKLAH